ncbi:MAG TPA: selenocysteine-specific translation elongation factor [Solirubrobacteraceae bacterium]|nr:selenocysteine-specific translation elongation factor [Solirubrobacteraceae bacterium]
MSAGQPPVTLGTAGHIDHGKTALVAALTGVDTDRLPEEQARGMSIELGYARLTLGDGRRVSVVDVPGHERFVRTMVAGAGGIDFYVMVVAADDGVMPQTREHAAVLGGLGVDRGVIAITKIDRADPEPAAAQAAELLPGIEIVRCSPPTGAGIPELAAALGRVADGLPGRSAADRPAVLHIDRVFTIRGAGTVVTGTLWWGRITRGDSLRLLPAGRDVRVRSVEVHDEAVETGQAGQRVAVNLSGIGVRELSRGDALIGGGSEIEPTTVLDCAVDLKPGAQDGERVQIHHGTRTAAGRAVGLGDGLWQIRLEAPILAASGDRIVVRSVAPPDTLGGGVILDPAARRHGRRSPAVDRLKRLSRGEPEPDEPAASGEDPPPVEVISAGAVLLEIRLRESGHHPEPVTALAGLAGELAELRSAGIAVRVGRDMYAHRAAVDDVGRRVAGIIDAEGSITLSRLRDDLGTSRKYAQAWLEHLDAGRVTKRLPDNRRVLRRHFGRD